MNPKYLKLCFEPKADHCLESAVAVCVIMMRMITEGYRFQKSVCMYNINADAHYSTLIFEMKYLKGVLQQFGITLS